MASDQLGIGQKIMRCTWPGLPETGLIGIAEHLKGDVWKFEPEKPNGRPRCFLTLNEMEEVNQ